MSRSGPAPDAPVVRAAGGVVWRRRHGTVEVVVVHRPAPRDDWSLPKGKLEDGERHRDACGSGRCGRRPACAAPSGIAWSRSATRRRGEDKRVRWWAMTVDSDDGFRPGHETDERRWVPLDDVDGLLSWDTDRTVLERFRSGSDA